MESIFKYEIGGEYSGPRSDKGAWGNICSGSRAGNEGGLKFMFEIDFLKGQGLPQKHRAIEAGVYTATAAFFILILLVLWIQFLQNKSELKSKQDQLARLEARAAKSCGQGSVKFHLENSLKVCDESYKEIADSIGRYVQWTPILQEFANSLPSSMVLNELSIIRSVEKKNITSKIEASKKVDYEIINRSIKSNIYDIASNCDRTTIVTYLESLRGTEPLKSLLKEAYVAESSDAEYKLYGVSRKVKNYVINYVLKPQQIVESK